MILLLCILITVGIFICDFCRYGFEFLEVLLASALGAVFGALVYFTIFLGVACVADTEIYKSNEVTLSAIQDNTSINGSFFLGSGSINSEMKYYYLIKNGNGFKMESVNANLATIIETSETPKIITYDYKYKNKFIKNNFPCIESSKYEIYIPEGSIKFNFKVDLQ